MCPTVGAYNFGTLAISIRNAFYRSGNFIIKAGPSAMAFKFAVGIIQRRITPAADISALLFVMQQFAGTGIFGAFVHNYIFFFCRKFIPLRAAFFNIDCGHFLIGLC